MPDAATEVTLITLPMHHVCSTMQSNANTTQKMQSAQKKGLPVKMPKLSQKLIILGVPQMLAQVNRISGTSNSSSIPLSSAQLRIVDMDPGGIPAGAGSKPGYR